MSTILKALRRLEDDAPKRKASPPTAPDVDALRGRILAEEAAARAARAEPEPPPVESPPSRSRLSARERRLLALAGAAVFLGLAFAAYQTNLFGAATPSAVTPTEALAAGSAPSPSTAPPGAPRANDDRPPRAMVAVPTPSAAHPTPEHAAAERARLASLAAAAATPPPSDVAAIAPPSDAAPTVAAPATSVPATSTQPTPIAPRAATSPTASTSPAAFPSASAASSRTASSSSAPPASSPAASQRAAVPVESLPIARNAASGESTGPGPRPAVGVPAVDPSATAQRDPRGAPPATTSSAPRVAEARNATASRAAASPAAKPVAVRAPSDASSLTTGSPPRSAPSPSSSASPSPSPSPSPSASASASRSASPSEETGSAVSRSTPGTSSSAAARPVPDRVDSTAPVEADSAATASPDVQRITSTQLPQVTVLRTAWHPKAERRSAKLRIIATGETLTVHEGDAAAGLVIKEVTPSSVVFDAGGIEIRRRIGESAGAR